MAGNISVYVGSQLIGSGLLGTNFPGDAGGVIRAYVTRVANGPYGEELLSEPYVDEPTARAAIDSLATSVGALAMVDTGLGDFNDYISPPGDEPALGNPATDGHILSSLVDGTRSWIAPPSGGSSDHGALTGLADDDHSQYHTDARGDARYYTQAQVDSDLSGKANTSHTHSAGDLNAGTLADARVAQSNVTQHEAALSLTESQISDLQPYLLAITKAMIEAELTGEISSHSHAGGGGGGDPSELIYYAHAADTGNIGVSALSTISWGTAKTIAAGVTSVSGEVTIPAAFDGRMARILWAVGGSGAGNRAELQTVLDIDPDGSSGYTTEKSSDNYVARNATQARGGVQGHHYIALATGMKIRVQAGLVGSNMAKVINATSLAIEVL